MTDAQIKTFKELMKIKLGACDEESITFIDNIVDGAGGLVLTAALKDGTYTLSATWQEIYDAVLNGKVVSLSVPTADNVIAGYDNSVFPLVYMCGDDVNGYGVVFGETSFSGAEKTDKPAYTPGS